MVAPDERETIERHVANVPRGNTRTRTVCPVCSHLRKQVNESEHVLVITFDNEGEGYRFKCHHCGISGAKQDGFAPLPARAEVVEATYAQYLSEGQLAFLTARCLSPATIEACGFVNGSVWIRKLGMEKPCLGANYTNPDGTIATKWRDDKKNFTQSGTGGCQTLWRIDEFSGGDLYIVEGEMDAASCEEVGILAHSVPNGAPEMVSEVTDASAKKYQYLWHAKAQLELADRIILFGDGDNQGQALNEEIARLVGRAKCWQGRYPDNCIERHGEEDGAAFKYCKDPSDVLVKHGPLTLRKMLKHVTPWPISGIRAPIEYEEGMRRLLETGFDFGKKTGIAALDELFMACPGTLNIITGVPSSGKSTFVKWLIIKLMTQENWNVAEASLEVGPELRLLQMAATLAGQPYIGDNKMSPEVAREALAFINDHYTIIDDENTDIESILERAASIVLRSGIRVLIIDPFNFVTGSIDAEEGSVASINNILTTLKRFAVNHDIAVFVIAHPTKMVTGADGRMPVPLGYDISGAASFFNSADFGGTLSVDSHGTSRFTAWKARHPWIGKTGTCQLAFDTDTETYSAVRYGPEPTVVPDKPMSQYVSKEWAELDRRMQGGHDDGDEVL